MGKRCLVEDSVDKFSWEGITAAGDNEPCWGLNSCFVKGKNSAGDDFPIATLLGITLLDFTRDDLLESTGDNSSNSTRDIFILHWGW